MKNEVNLKLFRDIDGSLLPVEFSSIKFVPRRIFMINDVPKGVIRGNHAHYETEQLLICTKGEILVFLDDGSKKTETILREGESIYVDKLVWDYQQFLTGNEMLTVICSTEYNAKDYINDIREFYKITNKGLL